MSPNPNPTRVTIRWPQRSILDWAKSQFGWHSPEKIAIRGNKEMAELLSALANNKPAFEIVEECADVAVFLFQIAESLGYDLLGMVDMKMDINEKRTWEIGSDGSHQHVKDPKVLESKPFTVINGHHLNKGISACTVCGSHDYTDICKGS